MEKEDECNAIALELEEKEKLLEQEKERIANDIKMSAQLIEEEKKMREEDWQRR